MLGELQKHLAGIYQADCGQRIADYLITDRAIAASIGAQDIHESIEETVLVAQDGAGLAVSVYLDKALLSRLARGNPLQHLKPRQLRDLSVVLEGLSHFNYLGWCAGQDKSVTLLELELQAEVDKFVATRLLAHEQNKPEITRMLHHWLFGDVSFHPSLNADERHRYETASDYAARFCRYLGQRMDDGFGMQELRHFYRLTQSEKISHIHSRVWN